jgi:hypothetical protein
VRLRLSALEERLLQRDHDFSALRQAEESTAAALTDAIVRLSRIEEQFGLAPIPHRKASASAPVLTRASTARNPTPALRSAIISDFPEVLAEFRGKRFALLWRGGRDGFGARDFHDRCDGHANTLTLIEDTKGNIFGGFTPLEWESRVWNGNQGKESNTFKADESMKSFLFTLKNPHNVPARRFALKAEKKHRAICCSSDCGPFLNAICVSNNCNTNTNSHSWLGYSYTNDTGLNGKTVFTGSEYFQVKEIVVFEITD